MLARKGVRFQVHSRLEHVKHSLPKQKPLAVSRDGNRTDTSGTGTDSTVLCQILQSRSQRLFGG